MISSLTKKINKLPSGYMQNVGEYIDFLIYKNSVPDSETAILSESSLACDWLRPEEDAAWESLWEEQEFASLS